MSSLASKREDRLLGGMARHFIFYIWLRESETFMLTGYKEWKSGAFFVFVVLFGLFLFSCLKLYCFFVFKSMSSTSFHHYTPLLILYSSISLYISGLHNVTVCIT